MQDSFTHIYSIVRQIPPGQVSSYGTIAALAGNPRWSRVVGYAMRACRDPAVPCHRVLYQDGTLSPAFFENGENRQKILLQREAVPFLPDGRVDMGACGWP